MHKKEVAIVLAVALLSGLVGYYVHGSMIESQIKAAQELQAQGIPVVVSQGNMSSFSVASIVMLVVVVIGLGYIYNAVKSRYEKLMEMVNARLQ